MTAFGQLVCQCGKPYAPTCEGLWLHRRLFDHTPSEAHEKTTEQKWSEATERAFSQVRAYNGTNETAPEGARNADEGLTTNLSNQEGAGPQC